MATICPFADWRPLPEAERQAPITPRVVIFHTAVGTLRSVERYFRDLTGIESHLMVGGPWDGPDLDGALWQWMDLRRRADANLDANGFAISVETSDNAPSTPDLIAPWSPRQLATLVRFGIWAAATFAIPRRVCPAWDQAGFGWHAMWGAPSPWTPAVGKQCPGRTRIRQLNEIVLPAIFAGRQLTEEDVFMALTDTEQQELLRAARQVNAAVGAGQTSFSGTVEATLRTVQTLVNEGRSQTSTLGAAITDIRSAVLAAVAALPTDLLDETDRQDLAERIVDAVVDAVAARLQRAASPAG